MGYKEVFEDDSALRCTYGLHKEETRSAWILILDYLLLKTSTKSALDQLKYLYTMWNLRGSTQQTLPESYVAYIQVGGVTPVTSQDVLNMIAVPIVNGKFKLETGIIETKFIFAVNSSLSVFSVTDFTTGGFAITAQYIQGATIAVASQNGSVDYTLYELNQGVPYSQTHFHEVTVN